MKFGLLIFFAANTLAAPFWVLNENLPRAEVKDVECSASRFARGKTFSYEYAGETLNKIEGSSTLETGLLITAKIFITAYDDCKFTMKVTNAELLQKGKADGAYVKNVDSAKFSGAIEEHDLMFYMKGNKVNSVHSHTAEPVYITNVKRGMLSAVQLNENGDIETDVNGVCRTTVTKKPDGSIVKTKDLSGCEERKTQEFGLDSNTFKSKGGLNVLRSNSKCVYTITDNTVINTVLCEETHLFRPFAAGYQQTSGAMTTTKQTMQLVDVKPAKPTRFAQSTNEGTILFDHSSEEQTATKQMKDTFDEIMSRLVNPEHEFSVRQDSAHEFASMVSLLRRMDQKRMKVVWKKYFNCIESNVCAATETDLKDVYRQYLLDGIAYCGTTTCIATVHDVIMKGEVTGERMNIFLQSIGLVAKTSKKTIRDVTNIAEQRPSRQAFLTLGSLLSRHCEKNQADCQDGVRNVITHAEKFLVDKLGPNCDGQDNHERVEEILMSLKAIANAKRPNRASHIILKCAASSQHTNITKAAFDALRSMSCEDGIANNLLDFVKDISNGPEKRVYAFVALMKCPTEVVVTQVVKVLEEEPSNQLASFMWTYLSNIAESSNIQHKTAKAILAKLASVKPLRKVDLPFYQFSKAFEKSVHLDSMNSGASAEAHIVYDHENYFPKSAFFDLTATVLGVPLQLVEANVGVEGLEELLEHVAESGDIPGGNWALKMFNITLTAQKLKEMAENRENVNHRLRRDVGHESKISQLHEQVNKRKVAPNGHLSFKVMGQEIRTLSYDDIYSMIDEIDNMNVIQLLYNVAKGGHKTFTKSMMFLEMTQTVPTGVGLPLKLKLIGSTVTSVELDGKFDIRNMFWGPGSMTVKGYVKPSAVVEITGEMGVQAHFASAGVFVNSSMFVSNIMKGNIIYNQGKMLKINLDVPEKPVELFNVGSTPFMYLNDKNEPIKGVDRVMEFKEICMKSEMIGVGLCTSGKLPLAYREYEAPYFPLSGPSHYKVNFIRADSQLTTYQFLTTLNKEQDNIIGKVSFSTPMATYERRLAGDILYSNVDATQILKISTGNADRSASVEMSYNSITHDSSITGKNNLLTEKEMIMKMAFHNKTTSTLNMEYGINFLAQYDWYKFNHLTMFARKPTQYLIQSTTEYYPGKKVDFVHEYDIEAQKATARYNVAGKELILTGEVENRGVEKGVKIVGTCSTSGESVTFYTGYINTPQKKSLITSATAMGKTVKNVLTYKDTNTKKSMENLLDVAGKTAQLLGEMTTENDVTTLSIQGDVIGKTANTKFTFTSNDIAKELVVTVKAAGKSAQSTLKYLLKEEGPSFTADVEVGGRKTNAFLNINSNEGYKSNMGVIVGEYVAGIKGAYIDTNNNVQSVCSSVYFGTKEVEREPWIACAKLQRLGQTFVHNKLSVSLKMTEMNKEYVQMFDVEKRNGQTKLTSSFSSDGNTYISQEISMKYHSLVQSELAMNLKVSKYSVGTTLYVKQVNDETHLGMKSSFMDKSLEILHRYSSRQHNKLNTELIQNGNVLPVSTELNLEYSDNIFAPSAKIVLGKYSIIYSTTFSADAGVYKILSEQMAKKEEELLVKTYQSSTITYKTDKKSIEERIGVTALGKNYEYGWNADYEYIPNQNTHIVTLQVQYSTDRTSTMKLSFSNTETNTNVEIDCEYFPGKTLTHFIKFDKVNGILDVSVEFLPKMFTKMKMKFDQTNGLTITTDATLQWNNYNRTLTFVDSYTNTDQATTWLASVGKILLLKATYYKQSPVKIVLIGTFMQHTASWTIDLSKTTLNNEILFNDKKVRLMIGGESATEKQLTITMHNGDQTMFKFSNVYQILEKRFTSVLSGDETWITVLGKLTGDEVTVSVTGDRQWLGIVGKRNSNTNTVDLSITTMETEALKIIIATPRNILSLTAISPFFDTKKFVGKYDPATKSLSLTCNCNSVQKTVTFRADYPNMVAGIELNQNNKKTGLRIFKREDAVIMRLTLTKKLVYQTVFELKQNNIVKITVQNKAGNSFVDQTSFKYKLSPTMSNFAFKWNKNAAKKLANFFTEIINDAEKNLKDLYTRLELIYTRSNTNAQEAYDMAFEEVGKWLTVTDFDKIREKSVETLKKSVEWTKEALLIVAEKLNTRLPEAAQQITQLPKMVKEWYKKAITVIDSLQTELNINWDDLTTKLTVAVHNITESSKPIVFKAIELINDFKIKGKTLREIMEIVQERKQEYIDLYSAIAMAKIEIAKVKGIEILTEGRDKIMKMEVPYTEGNVKDLIEKVMMKLKELKEKIETETNQMQVKIAAINWEEMIGKAKRKVMNLQINDQPVKAYIMMIRKEVNKLPKKLRSALVKLIKVVQKLNKDSRKFFEDVTTFSKPLLTHVKVVSKSIDKHLSPVFKKALRKIGDIMPTIPTERIDELINKIKDMKINGFRVGTVANMQATMMAEKTKELTESMKTKLDEQMKLLVEAVDDFSQMPPQQVVDKYIDLSTGASQSAIDYLKEIIAEQETVMRMLMIEIKATYTKMKTQYDEIISLPVEQILDSVLLKASEGIAKTSKKLAGLLKQLAEADYTKMSSDVWQKADARLKEYKIKEKVKGLIEAAKEVDIKAVTTKVIGQIKEFVQKIYAQVFVKSVKVYAQVERVVEYVKSIPKKDYEQWFNELKEFTTTHHERLQNVFETTLRSKYSEMYNKANEMYDNADQFMTTNAEKLHVDYIIPAQDWASLIAEKSKLVYEEVKEPSVAIYKHYKDIVVGLYNDNYEVVKAAFMAKMNALQDQLKYQMETLKGKMNDLVTQLENEYNNFLAKYGDMTWDDVIDETVNYGEQMIKMYKKSLKKMQKDLTKMYNKYERKALDIYNNMLAKVTEHREYLMTEVKPKVTDKYNFYKRMAVANINELKAIMQEYIEMYKEKVITLYALNKDKTLEQLSTEMIAMIENEYMVAKGKVEMMGKKYWEKIYVLVRTVIIPELQAESESMINQTLRISVILANETIKAYQPHINLLKIHGKKLIDATKEQFLFITDQMGLVREKTNELWDLTTQFVDNLRKQKSYRAIYYNENVKKIQALLEGLVSDVKAKLLALKEHTIVREYKQKLDETVKELGKYYEIMKPILQRYLEHPNFLKIKKVMKKIENSVSFTANKIVDRFVKDISKPTKMSLDFSSFAIGEVNDFMAELRIQPEQTFWRTLKRNTFYAKVFIEMLINISPRNIQMMTYYWQRALVQVKTEFIENYLDDWTKTSIKMLEKKAVKITKQVTRFVEDLPAHSKQWLATNYDYNMKKLSGIYTQQMTMWKQWPFRSFFVNQLWGEIGEEIMRHELVTDAIAATGTTKETLIELAKEVKILARERLADLRTLMTTKAETLKLRATEKYEQLLADFETYKSAAMEKYNKAIKDVKTFCRETTIEHIVTYIKVNVEDTKEEIEKIKTQLIEETNQQYEKAVELYNAYKMIGEAKCLEYYSRAMIFMEEKKVQYLPYYLEYKSKFMQTWNKYQPMMKTKYDELRTKISVKYAEVIARVTKLKKDIMREWMNSEIKAQLMAMRQMSIKDSIDALKTIPAELKTRTKRFVDEQRVNIENYREIAMQKINAKYTTFVRVLNNRIKSIIGPYIPTAKEVFNMVKHEVTETGLFVYRYYDLEENMFALKTLTINEYNRLVILGQVEAERYRALLKEYSEIYGNMMTEKVSELNENTMEYVKTNAPIVGHKILRGIHATMKYLDNIDVPEMRIQAEAVVREYMTELSKYVSFDLQNGEILINVPHGNIVPAFKQHVNKIKNKVRRSVDQVKVQGGEMLKKVDEKLAALKEKVQKLKTQLKERIMENTVELRSDLAQSYAINNKLTQRLYTKGKLYAQTAMTTYNNLRRSTKRLLVKAKTEINKKYQWLLVASKQAYMKSMEFFRELLENPKATLKNAYKFSVKTMKMVKTRSVNMYDKYEPVLKSELQTLKDKINSRVEFASNVYKLTYRTLNAAFRNWRAGMPAEKAFYPIIRQAMFAADILVFENIANMKQAICRSDPKLCKHARESLALHTSLAEKYLKRAEEMFTERRLNLIRNLRKSVRQLIHMKNLYIGVDYPETAIMFGNHVYTFDKTHYEFIDHKQRDCTYMLAHDFKDGKFSIMKQQDAVIIKTPEMEIKIKSDGRTKTTIDGRTITSLPVESGSNKCTRHSNVVKCELLNQGVYVKVYLTNFMTTVQLSKWHFGKSQGIFGTNNRESYDDLKMPDGEITDNVFKFANAYEMSGKRACKVTATPAATCTNEPSPRCQKLFNSEDSVFAKYYDMVDPEPFMEACERDTCQQKNHCKSANAYSAMVLAIGIKTEYCPFCVKVDSHTLNEEWTEKPKHAVDVVLMLSERSTIGPFKKQLMKIMLQVEQKMRTKQFKTRYTLIGFGGEGVHENAHIHPIGTGDDVFGTVQELTKEMKSMSFDGDATNKNDPFDAIIMASRMSFRPGASRLFVLYNNDDTKTSMFGATEIETQSYLTKQANASLFVFENLQLKPSVQIRGRFIGETSQRVYTDTFDEGTNKPTNHLVDSTFRPLTDATKGGLFTSKFTSVKKVVKSLYDAMSYNLQRVDSHCQRCTLNVKWNGAPKPICVTRNDIQC